LRASPVVMKAAELGNRQSRMRPHGVMPGRLFYLTRRGINHEPIDDARKLFSRRVVYRESPRSKPYAIQTAGSHRPVLSTIIQISVNDSTRQNPN
jgi:hypothetical protein